MDDEMNDVLTTLFSVNSQHWVEVTHITNPHDFYVLPIKCKGLVEKIQSCTPEIRPLSLNRLDVVLFETKKLDKRVLARGQIIDIVIENDIRKYTIFTLDYGSLELSVPEELIWNCDKDFVNLIPLAKSCRLAFCSPIEGEVWTRKSIDAFEYFVRNDQFKMKIKEVRPHRLVVELWNDHPDDISTLMAYTDYSTLGLLENSINRFSIAATKKLYYTYKELKINDSIRVRVQSGESLEGFYVAEVNDYQNYLKEGDNMSNFAKRQESLPSEKIKPGKILLALMRTNHIKNRYERAIIKKVLPEDKAVVLFVDWGKEEEVHIMNMKTISEKCLKMPVVAIFCSAEDNQFSNNEFCRFLRPGYEFFINIKQLGNKFESPNIVVISPIPRKEFKTKSK